MESSRRVHRAGGDTEVQMFWCIFVRSIDESKGLIVFHRDIIHLLEGGNIGLTEGFGKFWEGGDTMKLSFLAR